jgi:hypothetical protein
LFCAVLARKLQRILLAQQLLFRSGEPVEERSADARKFSVILTSGRTTRIHVFLLAGPVSFRKKVRINATMIP